jgi:hypothetical protein
MAPKRKNAELPLKSIWDEALLSAVLTNPQHRAKLWNHLILATRNSLPPSPGDEDASRMKKVNIVKPKASGCNGTTNSCSDRTTEECCGGSSSSSAAEAQVEHSPISCSVEEEDNTNNRCGSPTPSSTPSTHTTSNNRQPATQSGYKFKSILSLQDLPYQAWNIPKKQAQRIVQEFSLFTTKISERSESARGDTTKLLVQLQDGHQVETVIMRHVGHATACISSQIGCQMGCR